MTTNLLPFEGTITNLPPVEDGHTRQIIVSILSLNGKKLPNNECPEVKLTLRPNDNFRIGDYIFGQAMVDENGVVQQVIKITIVVPAPEPPTAPTEEDNEPDENDKPKSRFLNWLKKIICRWANWYNLW